MIEFRESQLNKNITENQGIMESSKIKEVTVFTDGDSSKLSTWSNVPYFFTETLLGKGIKVNRVDISESAQLCRVYNKFFDPFVKRMSKDTSYTYFRSRLHYSNVRKRVKKAVRTYKNSDVFLFLTLSFSSVGLTDKPTVMFGDWTYDYYIKHFLNRQPDCFERSCIKRDRRQIEKADLVLPLFPGIAGYMKENYSNPEIRYLGNVVNSLLLVSEKEILEKKRNSKELLFIGRKNAYLEGAEQLIKAVSLLKNDYPDVKVHIIGMKDSDFESLPDNVCCYGYLDKADDNRRNLYYTLLQNARFIVNTTPKWGAFSSMIEAMYFYNPVITTPYGEFTETFGKNIDFGYYSDGQSAEELAGQIKSGLQSPDYIQMCIRSHQSVEHFTWSAYVDKVIGILEDKLRVKN